MRPKYIKVPLQPARSFSIRYDAVPYFMKELHFHPEIELVYIHKGYGTQYIGNHVQDFTEGHMIMVGADTPHLWKCDAAFFKPRSRLKAEATVIHFLPGMFGTEFLDLPENQALHKLFQQAKLGLMINGKTKTVIAGLMQQLLQAKGSMAVLQLLQVLYTLAESKECKAINSKDFLSLPKEKHPARLNNVIQFMMSNYRRPIQLKEIAAIAHLSETAFCRYFKSRTNKTYSSFLMQLRIQNACKLLQDTDQPISSICYNSGFNNFSNFNRYFKLITGVTPYQYRSKMNEGN